MNDCLRVQKNTTETINATFLDTAGVLKTGLTVAVRIQRAGDGKYLKNDGSWTASPSTEYTAAELDATNRPGEYAFDFAIPDTLDIYSIRFDGGTGAANRYQFGKLKAVNDAEGDIHIAKAVLANRQEQSISTGIVTVMDDDDVTPLLTITPDVDDEENPTKNILSMS
ncbi:MAG: hypothetical protein MI923_08035 [Phycisphaerales bacterium]|nr:hypothetical protein [Phycisphaerales bacterium]